MHNIYIYPCIEECRTIMETLYYDNEHIVYCMGHSYCQPLARIDSYL